MGVRLGGDAERPRIKANVGGGQHPNGEAPQGRRTARMMASWYNQRSNALRGPSPMGISIGKGITAMATSQDGPNTGSLVNEIDSSLNR